jgi:DNA repair protein RecN (Recombination protein N)
MLAELRIKDFAIIQDLRVNFAEGLNLLTGETGAGKSIIVDALSMFLIPRAPIDLIRAGAKEAQIEALFYDVSHPLLEELSIQTDEGLILRRVISPQGKTKAYVNDSPVSIQTLTNIGSSLIAIHGQHEHQALLRPESHLHILDAYASLVDRLRDFSRLYDRVNSLQGQLNTLRQSVRERAQREDLLNYQIREINEADPKVGELEALTEEYKRLVNALRLRELAEEAYLILNGEDSALFRLKRAITAVSSIRDYDPSIQEVLDLLGSSHAIASDAVAILRDKRDLYEANPHRLGQVSERIDTLKGLLKKYGTTIEEVITYRDMATRELSELKVSVENEENLEAELKTLQGLMMAEASAISKIRQEALGSLEAEIIEELKGLGFKDPNFKVSIHTGLEVSATGIDEVEFLFSANPGEPLRPLSKVASGGELSRLMLALKVLLLKRQKQTERIDPSTLVFDEVDAGIGGATAFQVGKRLKAVASTCQTLCITHLPQIAALADHHLLIEKSSDQLSTSINVRELNLEDRRGEIARMLSGAVTEASLRHAEELLSAKGETWP